MWDSGNVDLALLEDLDRARSKVVRFRSLCKVQDWLSGEGWQLGQKWVLR